MTLADLSIKRPIFITCVVFAMVAVGVLSFKRLGIDLFPNITFPVVMINTAYPGAGPEEVETLVSKVIEEELSGVPGLKTLRSANKEGLSQVVAEFTLETDVKFAESQVRDRISAAKRKLPDDIKESTIRRLDPADQPVVIIAAKSDLPAAQLYEIADQKVKPKIEQINQVGLVTIAGGRRREIHVNLDQAKLKSYELSGTMVSNRLAASGQNIPVGTFNNGDKENTFRTIGEFRSLSDIGNAIVNFLGNDVPVTVNQVGQVVDTLEDETSRTFVNGQKSLLMMVFKQSGSNTVAVSDNVQAQVAKLNEDLKSLNQGVELQVVRDQALMVRANVDDVKESIMLGIILTIIVVYLFLGSGRSTIITGLALPNSLLGSFVLMAYAGFTINVMTLLALSLAVGLLVDDAIVVRENIFRHVELGEDPKYAASFGTKEVTLAVIATTLAVISVFGPIAFLKGVVGQFFREFGLTICFAMAISLFDALTVAPMLSAYFAGASDKTKRGIGYYTTGYVLRAFDRFQTMLENIYSVVLKFSIRAPAIIIAIALGLLGGSIYLAKFVPKTFLGAQDFGEFAVSLELEPGTSLEAMNAFAQKIDNLMHEHKEIANTVLTVGNSDGQANVADFFVNLVPRAQRDVNTTQMKDRLRKQLAEYAFARPKVKDIDAVGGGMRPFTFNIKGFDLKQLEDIATQMYEKLKDNPALTDVDVSHRPGKPETQIVADRVKAERLGIANNVLGAELRTLIEGSTPAVFREQGQEYDIRVRLQENQRDLKQRFNATFVPNINNYLVRLSDVAKINQTTGPANINREDRGRYIQVSADVTPGGPGMAQAMADVKRIFDEEVKLPPGVSYSYVGQAESFKELIESVILAGMLAVLFIYLVLASLYESFVTPFTIMLVLPLAICGALIALFICKSSLDLNSMIGCILLMGIASKNSILLVDYTKQKVEEGMDRSEALLEAGRTRLRPILMTTVALIAGMAPIAYGLNEASKQRTSMGIAVIGGLISSTLLSLLVVPAVYSWVDRFRVFMGTTLGRIFIAKPHHHNQDH